MTANDNTALSLFECAFKAYANRPAFSCLGVTVSYQEIDQKSAALAAYFAHALKLLPGDRIALQMPNIVQYPIAVYAALRAGLVIVNVNPLYTERELKHQLNDSGAKALVVLANVAQKAANIISETNVEHVLVTQLADFMPWPKRAIVNFVVNRVKKMIPAFKFEQSISYLTALSVGTSLTVQNISVAPEDIAVLQYTGGTTGVAKGAMLSQFNLYSNVRQLKHHYPEFFSEDAEVFGAPLPLYHIYALNLHLLAGFSNGAHSILIPNPRDLTALFDAFALVKVTVFVGINTLFNAMLSHKRMAEFDYSALKVTAAGGMALTQDVAKSWEKKTGCPISEGYGLTETSPVVAGNQLSKMRLGSVGTAIIDTEVKVVNELGETLPTGEAGELFIRGPQVMIGYWNKPEATQEVLTEDGWFKSGDIAVIDEDGFIKIVDRKKDMIIVSGFNVYPNEIEDVAMLHPLILEAAVIGVKSEECGEQVKIFIVAKDKTLTEKDVIDHCRKNLTAYKIPKVVVFRDELPKSNVGKILRKDLRD